MTQTAPLTKWLAELPSGPASASVEIADYHRSRYRRRLILTPRSADYELVFSIEPTITDAQFRRMNWTSRYKFFQDLGAIQHVDALRELSLLAYTMSEITQGRSWQTAACCRPANRGRPYAPEGPWQYIPPEGHDDWRTRARAILPRNDAVPPRVLAMNLYLSTLDFPPSSLDTLVTEGLTRIRVRATSQHLFPSSLQNRVA